MIERPRPESNQRRFKILAGEAVPGREHQVRAGFPCASANQVTAGLQGDLVVVRATRSLQHSN